MTGSYIEYRIGMNTGYVYNNRTRIGFSPAHTDHSGKTPEGYTYIWGCRGYPDPTHKEVVEAEALLTEAGLKVKHT